MKFTHLFDEFTQTFLILHFHIHFTKKRTNIIFIEIFAILLLVKLFAIYPVLLSKMFCPKFWSCEYFDKFHVCLCTTSGPPFNLWTLWVGALCQNMSSQTLGLINISSYNLHRMNENFVIDQCFLNPTFDTLTLMSTNPQQNASFGLCPPSPLLVVSFCKPILPRYACGSAVQRMTTVFLCWECS